jgi:hypothetical protein
MGEFTYQEDAYGFKLENWEWDNTWIDHPNDRQKKRFFYIGDSISCGTRRMFRAVSDKYTCDGFGTSKGLDNPFFCDGIRYFAAQLNGFECVLFNNGLHGWHLDNEQYEKCYEKMVKFLISEFKGVPVYIVLTTSTKGDEELGENSRVRKRNAAASRVAEKYGLKVIDLYTVSLENKDLRTDDGVHFTDEGYKVFAKYIFECVSKNSQRKDF